MKKLIYILILIVPIKLGFGQIETSSPCEVISKGKKQGLFDVTKNTWIFPLDKQQIIEFHPNFYASINRKTSTTQGVFKNNLYQFISEKGNSSLLGFDSQVDRYDFENVLISKDGNKFGKEIYPYFRPKFLGAIFQGNFLLLGTSQDLNHSCVSLKIEEKNNPTNSIEFKNVHWRIYEDILFVISYRLDSVFRSLDDYGNVDSSIVEEHLKLETYDLSSNDIAGFLQSKKLISVLENGTENEQFNGYNNWLHYYNGAPVVSPEEQHFANKNVATFDALMSSDFKTDSSSKYDLILQLDHVILFVNQNGAWVSSPEQLFKKLEDDKLLDFSNYELGRFVKIRILGQKLIIQDLTQPRSEYLFDSVTDEEFIITEQGVYNSGIWDLQQKKWILDPKYANVGIENNKLIALEYLTAAIEPFDIEKTNVHLFNADGSLINTFDSEDYDFYKTLFDGDSIYKSPNQYYLFVFKEGNSMLISLGFDPVNSTVLANYKDNPLPQTFNESNQSFISKPNEDFYFNTVDVEAGIFTQKIEAKFFGICPAENEYDWGTFVSSQDNSACKIVSGIENYGDYSILRNITKTKFYEYQAYDVEGWEKYDYNGNPIYYYEISPGHYNTGLWSNQKSNWLISPIYSDIILLKDGFTAVETREYYQLMKEETYNTEKFDSIILIFHVFDNQFNEIKTFSDKDKPYENPAFFPYLCNVDTNVKTIQIPFMIDNEISSRIGSYYWLEAGGKYTMVETDYMSKVDPIILKADWMHEANDILYFVKDDTLYIKHKNGSGKNDIKLHHDGNSEVEIKQSDYYLTISVNGQNMCYQLSEYNEFQIAQELNVSNEEFYHAKISLQKDKILVTSNYYKSYEGYINWGEDFYFYTIKANRDIIWLNHEKKWIYAADAAKITELPFGYCFDKNMGEANSDYATEQKYTYGDTYICDKNLKKLEFPEFESFYKIEKLNETQQYILLYTTDSSSRYAIVNDKGEIITQIDNYNNYEIREDKIIFMNYDEYGDVEVDENGNIKEFIYSF